jgi:hypothetical protein
VTLGGLERWFSPRGQDLAFLLSCIGLVRPSSSADLKQKQNKFLFLVDVLYGVLHVWHSEVERLQMLVMEKS